MYGGDDVRKKPFFMFGAIMSILLFIMFYSYFWYRLGKFGLNLEGDGSAIMIMIYLFILAIVTVEQYRSSYYVRSKSLTSTVLYEMPLLLLIIPIFVIK
jgi:hypothetical protein